MAFLFSPPDLHSALQSSVSILQFTEMPHTAVASLWVGTDCCVSPCPSCSSALMSCCLSLPSLSSLGNGRLGCDEPSKDVCGCLTSVTISSAVRQVVSDAVDTFVRELRAGGPHAPDASGGPSAPARGPAGGAPAAAQPQQATGSQAPPPMAAKPAAKVRRQLQPLPHGPNYSSRM